jgi:asparagine synthase (glutamine-hydrolysing)
MVGLCGVLGGGRVVPEMVEELAWTGEERRHAFADGALDVRGLVHDSPASTGPATVADGEVTVWLDGTVYGFEDGRGGRAGDGYRPRGAVDSAAFCGRLYEAHGPAFVAGLNGGFAGVLYDRAAERVFLFTDRLATRELFYTRPDDGTLVFSSRLQGLPLHPAVSTGFDPEYLLEYFACRRSYGVTTPLEGVRLVPPGSVMSVDLAASDLEVDVERYWQPRHRPIDRPFSWFVDEFVERLRLSVAERTAVDGTCGILLSGGSDARLVLATLDALEDVDVDVIAYHISDWMTPEARLAERIALTAGVEFRHLRRGPDYYERLLGRTPKLSNFVQRFHQGFAEGFADRIREEVDYLVTGHFADTWFRGHHLPTRPGPMGLGRRAREITSTAEYVDYLLREAPAYVDATTSDLRAVLAENVVERDDGSVLYHGVEFDSVADLAIYGRLVPKGTDPFFRRSLRESLPFRPPLLDTRLLDLATTVPLAYQRRRNVVDAAVERLAPDLAAIPSANTSVPLTYPDPVKRAAGLGTRLLRKLLPRLPLPGVGPPRPWQNYGAWGDHPALLRHRTFAPETLSRREEVFESVPLLDHDGARACYEEHLDGANRTKPLYALLTFLEMPVVERLCGDGPDGSTPPSEPERTADESTGSSMR